MKYWVFGLCLAAMSPAWACSQLPPFGVWVMQNDANHDGKLSRKEFLKAKWGKNLQGSFSLTKKSFQKLDRNRNGFLENDDQEWYQLVQYKRAPCADWEEKMQQMMQQEKAKQNQETIWLPAQ